MVTNNPMPTADMAVIQQSVQVQQPTTAAETDAPAFSEYLRNAEAQPMQTAQAAQPVEAVIAAQSEAADELVSQLGDILGNMLKAAEESGAEKAEILSSLKGLAEKLDSKDDETAQELILSVIADVSSINADMPQEMQQEIYSGAAASVDFVTEQSIKPAAEFFMQTAEMQTVQSQPAQQTAENMMTVLMSFAKENLGLEKAEVYVRANAETAQPAPQTAEQFRQSMGFGYAKAADSGKSAELEQLIAELGANQPAQQKTQTAQTAQPAQQTDAPADNAARTAEIPVAAETADGANAESAERETVRTEQNVLPESAQTVQTSGVTAEIPDNGAVVQKTVEAQLSEAIYDKLPQITDGKTEFVMELNPESLGKVEIRLTSDAEGRITVEITASSPETQKLLDARAENVQQALRNNGVELERYQVVYSAEQSAFEQQSYEGSSKNPYLQQEENSTEENDDGVNFADILGTM